MEKIVIYIYAKIKMTKEEYYDALKSPQWIEKRNSILLERGSKCERCGDTNHLLDSNSRKPCSLDPLGQGWIEKK